MKKQYAGKTCFSFLFLLFILICNQLFKGFQDSHTTFSSAGNGNDSEIVATLTNAFLKNQDKRASSLQFLFNKEKKPQSIFATGNYTSPAIGNESCFATGSILREYWANVSGSTSISSIPLNQTPTSSTEILSFETPSNFADNYGQRIRGYICAPRTGQYTFYIASNNNSELWLSTNSSPSAKKRIAYVNGWTSPRAWFTYRSQKSAAITLTAGTSYYIEALHKETTTWDNLAVGWKLPGSSSIQVIPGSVLSPVLLSKPLKVNFQDSATTTPAGWLKDFGQSFSQRTSGNQGTGNSYGWKKSTDGAPLDYRQYGRVRNTPADPLLASFMHMQANGAPAGIWEAQVQNGNYDVTVSVGDGSYIDSKHSITVEGVPTIVNFTPLTTTRFRTSTVSVTVSDNLLTVTPTGGTNTKINYISIQPSAGRRPSVVQLNPENGSQNISDLASISTSIINLPNGGINNATLTSSTVYVEESSTKVKVPANVNGTGGGDAITLVPASPLKLNTTYTFTITSGVKDLSNASFLPFSSSFTTSSVTSNTTTPIKFTKVDLPNAAGRHSSLVIGPDKKLYALTIDGIIKRFIINADGTLQNPELIYTLQDQSGIRSQRLAIGLTFDPASTATNLIAYVTHSTFVFQNGPDWDGRLTRLSGINLEKVQDLVINLPRSSKDHLTNSLAFGPDGALYFTQGSNSAMGMADKIWNYREEHLLSGSVMRLDLNRLGILPLNAKTKDGGGNYNPYTPGAPLTIYASGIRNAYDLVWHSNGELYVPTNGSAAGGNTPASIAGTLRTDGTMYNGPVVPSLTNVQPTHSDYLFRVKKGGYYGHPNATRGEFVSNGGNPTAGIDPAQVEAYPVGTLPDANWRGFSFDFQINKSPNGAIEYKSNSFNGALKGKLLVTRYSQNDDIITLTPGGTAKDIIGSIEGASIQGFSGFIDPLDLVEDTRNGNLYVSEYGGSGKLTLLKPASGEFTTKVSVTPHSGREATGDLSPNK